jgi:hypothetical protein
MRVCLAAHFPPAIVLPGQPAELARAASGLLIGVDGLSWPGRAGRRQTIRQVWVRTSNTMSPRRSNSRSPGATRVGEWPYRDGADFVVARGPGGSGFCVIDHRGL